MSVLAATQGCPFQILWAARDAPGPAQFDTLLGILTVYEMLLYTAELKRPWQEPLERKKHAVGGGWARVQRGACSRWQGLRTPRPSLRY
jgi:hypothetical protein